MSAPMQSLASPFYGPEHEDFRATVRRFVEREIAPHADEWDEAGSFPRALYEKAGAAGLLAIGFPEEYGGIPDDPFLRLILCEELAWGGNGGVQASLFSHTIGAPPIAAAGHAEVKRRWLPDILAGRAISALAITEPGGGSDVAGLSPQIRREGDEYILNGRKIFITSAMRADVFTVAARCGPEGGLSLIVVDAKSPGITRTALKKTGWWSSDTAELVFEGVRVPAINLLGEEGRGFRLIMNNFNGERVTLAATALGAAQVCYHDALAWARLRQTFGKRLADHQVIRHKLADMKMRLEATRGWLEMVAWRLRQCGSKPNAELIAEICLIKNFSTQTMQFCADCAVQIMGGMGFMRGSRIERIYREVKVMMIGGGAEEIMKDLAARQLDF